MSWFFWMIVVGAFIVGLVGIPFGMLLLGPSLSRGIRGVVGRIQWTIGALVRGDYGLYERANGRPDLVDADYARNEIRVDPEWLDVMELVSVGEFEIDGTPVEIEMVEIGTLELDRRVDLSDSDGLRSKLPFVEVEDTDEWPRDTIEFADLIGHEIAVEDHRLIIDEVDPDGNRIHATEHWRKLADDSEWSMLGKQPFVLCAEDDESAFGNLVAKSEEVPSSDGEIQRLSRERGGYPVVSAVTPDDGYAIEVLKLVDRWRDAAGTAVASEGKTQALKVHGGDKGDLSNKQLVIGIILSMTIAGAFGYLSFFL